MKPDVKRECLEGNIEIRFFTQNKINTEFEKMQNSFTGYGI